MFLLSERIFFYHFGTKLPSLWLHVPWTIQIQIWNSWGLWVHGHISQGGVSSLFYWQVFLVPEQHSPSVSWVYEKVDILQVFFHSEGDIASVGKRSSVRPPILPRPWVSTSDSCMHETAKTKAQIRVDSKFLQNQSILGASVAHLPL